jgi:hypothetical protein
LKARTARRAFAIAEHYRAPGISVVFGGSHTSLAPDHVRPHASALLIGSAEGMQREGRIFDTNTDNYDEQHVVFTPRRLAAQALLDGYRRAVRSFHSLGSITRRIAGNIGTPGVRDAWPYLANFGWRAEYLRSLESAEPGTSSSLA